MKHLQKLVTACLIMIFSGLVTASDNNRHLTNLNKITIKSEGNTGSSFESTEIVIAQSEQPKLKYTSELHWYMTHACSTEEKPGLRVESTPINFRFFEILNGERTGETWPDNKKNIYTVRGHSLFKNTETIRVNCAYPTQVCYGAKLDDEKSTGRWGVSLDGQGKCVSCCYSCPPRGWKDVRIQFNCN